MNIDRLRALAEGWRAEAGVLRKRGATAQAEALESCVADHEQVLNDWHTEELTLRQAAGPWHAHTAAASAREQPAPRLSTPPLSPHHRDPNNAAGDLRPVEPMEGPRRA